MKFSSPAALKNVIRQILMQQLMKISSKWQHLRLSDCHDNREYVTAVTKCDKRHYCYHYITAVLIKWKDEPRKHILGQTGFQI